jgi:nitrate reductase gamma subunit
MGYASFILILIGIATFLVARRVFQKQGSDKAAAARSVIVFILIYLVMGGIVMTLFSLAGAFGR